MTVLMSPKKLPGTWAMKSEYIQYFGSWETYPFTAKNRPYSVAFLMVYMEANRGYANPQFAAVY